VKGPPAIALPTFRKKLRKREAAGLVQSRKEGRVRIVEAQSQPLRAAERWLADQRTQWERRLDRLEALAQKMERTQS